jgi:hypothetical protein
MSTSTRMPRTVTLPIPEPLALLDATVLFVIQVLIAQHPDLLAPPEEPAPATPGLRSARRILDAVRDLHIALDTYRESRPADLRRDDPNDDIPF